MALHGDRVGAAQKTAGVPSSLVTGRAVCRPTCRVHWHGCYGIDTAPLEHRVSFLDRVERTFARLP